MRAANQKNAPDRKAVRLFSEPLYHKQLTVEATMRFLLLSTIVLIIMTACSSVSVNRDAILSAYSQINVSNGINKDEMKVIAQRFLLVTSEEPCKSNVNNVAISNPEIKCGWSHPDKNDHGCYIGFSKKGIFEIIPLYVEVSVVTGEASCAGYQVLK